MSLHQASSWKLTVLLLAFAACATNGARSGAGRPPSSAAIDYYPLLPKWGWAYQVERDGVNVLALYSVAEARDGTAIVKNGDEQIRYAILPDGIARLEGSSLGDYLLKSPVVAGAEWSVTDGSAKVAEVGKVVTLPSGNYRDCVLVEETRREPSRVTRTSYCRDVGPVEIDMRVWSPSKQIFDAVVHARLMSLSRPEDGDQ